MQWFYLKVLFTIRQHITYNNQSCLGGWLLITQQMGLVCFQTKVRWQLNY